MPIEKILIRILIVLSLVFFILSLVYYPPSYALAPALFFIVFVTGDFILPDQSKLEGKKDESLLSKIIVVLLVLVVTGCIASLFTIWKWGHFGRFALS